MFSTLRSVFLDALVFVDTVRWIGAAFDSARDDDDDGDTVRWYVASDVELNTDQ